MGGNRNAKRTEKYKNKITQGKLVEKNHKTTKSKTNTGIERLVEWAGGGGRGGGEGWLKQPANFTLGPDATLEGLNSAGPVCS